MFHGIVCGGPHVSPISYIIILFYRGEMFKANRFSACAVFPSLPW